MGREMDEKIENATKLITGGTGGYFVIGLNEDGQPNETFWMDSPDKETATYVLRVNQNGIGFSTTGIDGPYSNAWTIDGNLVANFITAGTMLADRIRGGSLEIGGTGLGKNGVIYVKDASGNIIAQIDINGVSISKGTINLGDGALQISSDGTISITKGSIDIGNGAFKVSSSGVMELSGTNNASSIGCNVLRAISANINNLVVNEDSDFAGTINAIDIDCREIQCTQIYSSVAQEWWSDRRLKKNVQTIPSSICLEIIKSLRPVSFDFKDSGHPSVGFIAQEVNKILKKRNIDLPLVGKHKGYFCIPYASYVTLLAGAIQEQQKEIEQLRRERHGGHKPRNQ